MADREQQAESSGRPVRAASAAELAEFRKEWTRSWRTVHWDRIPG